MNRNTVAGAETKGLFLAGGLSAVGIGLLYVAVIAAYTVTGAVPDEMPQALKDMSSHTGLWWIILVLSVLTDLLYLPVLVVLYVTLRPINRNLTLAGIGLVGLFVVLDLAVTWPNYSTLISLGQQSVGALSAPQQAAILAGATYAHSIVKSQLLAYYIILAPAIGILLTSIPMRESRLYHRPTVYVGIATGVLGIAATIGAHFSGVLGQAVFLSSLGTIVWMVLLGVRLLRASAHGSPVGVIPAPVHTMPVSGSRCTTEPDAEPPQR